MVKTRLFDHCLTLPYEFTTTNIILNELYPEQITIVQAHINSGKFMLIEISAKELEEIQLVSLEDTHLSEQDWSAYYYAKQKNTLLLTGDKRLRKIAESAGLVVCGIFWILDELVDKGILEKTTACIFLKDLMLKNKRLPADDCQKRISVWCSE